MPIEAVADLDSVAVESAGTNRGEDEVRTMVRRTRASAPGRARRAPSEAGFSLLELLVVIVVLGIISGVVIAAVGHTRANAAASVCKADVKAIELSVAGIATHTGSNPTVDTSKSNPQQRFANLLESANNGAMLKTYPISANYVLEYVAASNTVNVFPPGTAYGTGGPMTVGALGVSNAGCDALS